MKKTHYSHFLAAGLIAIFVVSAALSVWQKSTTWDEPFHLTAGVTQLQTGDPRLSFDHPPLARLVAAIPTLFMALDSVADKMGVAWLKADLIKAPNTFMGVIEDRALWPARLMMLIFSVLLGWLLYLWGLQLFGPIRALLPLALFAFCPPLLANAPIVATDMPITALLFAAIYTWWRYLQRPGLGRLAWVCGAVGAAFATKFTAVLLVPLLIFLGAVTLAAPSLLAGSFMRRLQVIAGGLLLVGLATVFAIDLAYNFKGVFLTPPNYVAKAYGLYSSIQLGAEQLTHFWPGWLPVPLPFSYVSGFLAVVGNVGDKGHLTYFIGQAGNGGWPNYFLMLLLVKLPIPTLILIGLGLGRIVERLPRDWWRLLFLMAPPLLLIGVASLGKMQIGIRHILPALPFLFLLAGYGVEGVYRIGRSAFVIALLALNMVSSFAIYPYYLMYFNFLGGGAEQGWRISITGDDWGQGDADLRRWLQARRIKSLVYLPDGWGGVILSRAGIRFTSPPCHDTGELVAIHAERLVTTVTVDEANCYAWMRLREPDEKIDYSIFLYNSKNARPGPPDNLTLFSSALRLQLAGQLPEAVVQYQMYLEQQPDYYQAHFNLGIALKDLHQYAAAISEFERTLELWPGYKEAHLHLAYCYKELGMTEEMRRHESLYQ